MITFNIFCIIFLQALFQITSQFPTDGSDKNVDLEEMARNIRQLQMESKLQKKTDGDLKEDILQLQRENNFLRKQGGVAFTAVSNANTYFGNGQNIVFEAEIYDGDSNYDGNAIFTCPASGVYYFSTEILGQTETDSTYCIQVGATEAGCNHSNGGDGADAGGASAAIHCPAGTQVTVQAKNAGATTHGAYGGKSMATFSGFLISLDL